MAFNTNQPHCSRSESKFIPNVKTEPNSVDDDFSLQDLNTYANHARSSQVLHDFKSPTVSAICVPFVETNHINGSLMPFRRNAKKKKKNAKRKADTNSNCESSSKRRADAIRNDDAMDSEDWGEEPRESENPFDDPRVKKHTCYAVLKGNIPIFERKLQLPQYYRPSSPEEDESIILANDEVTNLIERNLSSNNAKLNEKIDDINHLVKAYQWEKLVKSESLSTVDGSMRQTVESILLPQYECKRILNDVIGHLNEAFRDEKFTNRWDWYGSYLYGLVCEDTEIDIFYECDSLKTYTPEELIRNLWKSIQRSTHFREVADLTYPVPSIKARHNLTNKIVHIKFSEKVKVSCSLLMKFYLGLNPNLRLLITYVKLVLEKYGFQETNNKFQLNIIFWLVTFFMQQKKLLPAVIDVRKAAKMKHFVAGWDCSLPENYSFEAEPVSLYALFLEFFEFYTNFNFLKYVVCPYLGRVLLLSDLERLQMPNEEFSVYLRQLRSPEQLTFSSRLMNLQDPTDLSSNLGEAVEQNLLNRFINVCYRLSEVLQRDMAEIIKLDCACQLLPCSIEYGKYNPFDLTSFGLFRLEIDSLPKRCISKLNQIYVMEAVRKLMELVFKFEKKSIVIAQNVAEIKLDGKNDRIIRQTFPVLYFEYYSSENTWTNDYMKEIIPQDEDAKESVPIYLKCEIRLEEGLVLVFCRSQVNFITFLHENFLRLLSFILTQAVPC